MGPGVHLTDLMHIQELLDALLSREWRNRQSAALAACDLLSGRRYDEVEVSFRILPDAL